MHPLAASSSSSRPPLFCARIRAAGTVLGQRGTAGTVLTEQWDAAGTVLEMQQAAGTILTEQWGQTPEAEQRGRFSINGDRPHCTTQTPEVEQRGRFSLCLAYLETTPKNRTLGRRNARLKAHEGADKPLNCAIETIWQWLGRCISTQ